MADCLLKSKVDVGRNPTQVLDAPKYYVPKASDCNGESTLCYAKKYLL
jgi:hypothetical protein